MKPIASVLIHPILSFQKNCVRRWLICPEAHLTEFYTATMAAWWAFLLFAPTHLFATNPSFLGMSEVGTEHSWGLFALSLSVVAFGGLLMGVTILRFWGGIGGTFYWYFMASNIAKTAPHYGIYPVNTGFGAYGLDAVCSAVTILLLSPYLLADTVAMTERYASNRRNRRKRKPGCAPEPTPDPDQVA